MLQIGVDLAVPNEKEVSTHFDDSVRHSSRPVKASESVGRHELPASNEALARRCLREPAE
jgi:hypothetical protein